MLLMQHPQLSSIPMCLLSVDAEKAFDRVSWAFLQHTLVQMGLGPRIIFSILTLYTCPSARVTVNGSLTLSLTIP